MEERKKSIWIKILTTLISFLIIGGLAFGAYKIYNYIKNKGLNKITQNIFNPGPLQGPIRPTRAKNLDPKKIIKWTNYYREQENIDPLNENQKLDDAALKKVEDMFDRGYFEHTSPAGLTASDLVTAEGYKYKIVGENLALGDFKDEKDLVDAWMASPGHRANILKADFKDIGVAAKLDTYQGRITWISVQEFAAPLPNCALPSASLKRQIDEKEREYETNQTQIQTLYQDGNSLVQQGNQKIQQGNQVYAQTHDKSQAQPYWDEGNDLQDQGRAKINQAQELEQTNKTLYNEIQSLTDEYNQQVTKYNQCISS